MTNVLVILVSQGHRTNQWVQVANPLVAKRETLEDYDGVTPRFSV